MRSSSSSTRRFSVRSGSSSVSLATEPSEPVNSSTACGEREYNHEALVLGQLIRPPRSISGVRV